MTARDGLRGTLCNTVCNVSNYTKRAQPYLLGSDMSIVLDKTVDAILAAGYRKTRTITTAEELDALQFEAVIRDSEGHVLERWGEPDESLWTTVMVNAFIPRDDIALPATVLYEPEPAK